MDFSKINSDNYDFLWTVGGFSPFFISSWLSDEYIKRDFICVWHNDIWTLYVSKEERRKLAKEGLKFFLENFDDYRKSALEKIKQMDTFFGLKKIIKTSTLDNKSLAALLVESME